MFSLDTTRASAQNPGNFSMGFPFRGTVQFAGCAEPAWEVEKFTETKRNRASFQRGKPIAIPAGMDCAMHQPGVRGSRPLAASC